MFKCTTSLCLHSALYCRVVSGKDSISYAVDKNNIPCPKKKKKSYSAELLWLQDSSSSSVIHFPPL